MENQPPPPQYTVIVQRTHAGVWQEDEYTRTGQKDAEGHDEYKYLPIVKFRTKTLEIFRYETDSEPDLLALSRLMERGRKKS